MKITESTLVLLAIAMISLNSPGKKKILRQGVLTHQVYFTNVEKTDTLPLVNNFESRIWFKDSCVIYEVKVQWGVNHMMENGISRKDGYDILKYTFLDLRTKKCQDYLNFSDTATPVVNYQLQKSDVVSWQFYYDKDPRDSAGIKSFLPDTLINGVTYRRIRFLNKGDGFAYEKTNYLDCQSKRNIFHINRALDEAYPDCQVVRSDMRTDLNSPLTSVFIARIDREKLTSSELKIFEKWKNNGISTKLPLLRFEEANRVILPPAKF